MEENNKTKYISVLSFKSGIDVRIFAASSELEAIELSIIYMDIVEEGTKHNNSNVYVYPLDSFEIIDRKMLADFQNENVEELVEEYCDKLLSNPNMFINFSTNDSKMTDILKWAFKKNAYDYEHKNFIIGLGYTCDMFARRFNYKDIFRTIGINLPKVVKFSNPFKLIERSK